jgi:acyl-CoA thioesterase
VSVGELTGDALARACAEAMLSRDQASQTLGIVLDEARVGYARCSLVVGPAMVNGHGRAHGGITFTLADTAFAFGCNSRNEASVGMQASISYIAAAKLGERLIAECREQSVRGSSGVYDITVTSEDGALIALFRGVSHRIRGTVLEGEST